ncbi:MAG TPA: S49 family peptidase [Pyrinomonadaceae bacterium]|nr:S49 family peptidase [Pyrinomonadaceae bacterium]
MSTTRVFDFYASKSWAILPESLSEMINVYKAAIARKALEQDFDVEAVAARLGRPLNNTRLVTVRDSVAVIPITGPIMRYANIFTEISGATSIEILARDFTAALDDPAVQTIVLDINSPGGEMDGTSELAQMIFAARGRKRIRAYVSNLGASAAYWLASAAEQVTVADTASLGSIGVVGAMRTSKDEDIVEFVSSQSPNKRPDPLTESGKAQLQAHVDALAKVFIETVAKYRGMTPQQVINNGGAGGLKVGRDAITAGLADQVGTLEGVIRELQTQSGEQQRITMQTQADIYAVIQSKAAQLQKQDPQLTKAQAFDKAWTANPELREQYRSAPTVPTAPIAKPDQWAGRAAEKTVYNEIVAQAEELRKRQPELSNAQAFDRIWTASPELRARYEEARSTDGRAA